MEVLNWKNTLLEWANRLDFLGRPYYSLNLVDIETFFNEFKGKIKSVDIARMQLESFIKGYYPTFEVKYNEEGKMCQEDYVYGYSLLMHFSCVLYPESKFQNICKDMQQETQLTVRTFLQNLMERKSFSRETIKSVIETSAPAKISDYVLVLSPVKAVELDLCPPTPRTKLLNDWSSENRQLKAQVETERFEKGFLELQVKKLEEQINSLMQERRKFKTDIEALNTRLSEKDLENIRPNNNYTDSEVLKRRLRKEIDDKDATIVELQQKINDLNDAREHLSGKLAYVESQYNKSIESTNYLMAKLDELTDDSEKKIQHIEGLEIAIKDYQKYINDMHPKSASLDVSTDNLDDSYAIAMSNLPKSSMPSPENLGKIVDIQLRDQIGLYDQLLDKYHNLQEENSRLNKQIVDLFDENNLNIKDLESKCRQIQDENSSNLKKYEDKLQEIATLSKESKKNLKEFQLLRVELDSLISEKSSLENQMKKCEREAITLEVNNKAIAAENADYLCQIERFTSKQSDLELEVANSNVMINSLQSSILQLQVQMETSMESESLLKTEVDRLTQLLDDCHSQINHLGIEKQSLNEDYTVILNNNNLGLQKLAQLTAELEKHAKLVSDLTARIETAEGDLIAAETSKSVLAARYEELKLQSDAKLGEIETERNSLSAEVKNLANCLSDEEAVKFKYLARIKELNQEKDAALLQVEKEKNELSAEIGNLIARVEATKAELSAVETLKSDLAARHEELKLQKDAKLSEIKNERDNLSAEVKNLTACLSEKEALGIKLVARNEELILEKGAALLQVEKEKTELRAEVSYLSAHLDSIKASLTAAQSLHEKLSATNEELTQEIVNKTNEIETLILESKDNKQERVTLNEKIVSLTNQIEKLQDERKLIDSTLIDLSASNQLIKSESHLLREQLESNKVIRLDLETQLNQSEEEKEKLFLTLQEKIDEAEAMEFNFNEVKQNNQAIEATRCEILLEKNTLASEVSQLKSNCSIFENTINELEKTMCELTADKENLAKTNDTLNQEIDGNREKLTQLFATIEQLKTTNAQLSDKSLLLEHKLKESNNEHIQLEKKFNDLEMENGKIKKTGEELEAKLDELTIRIANSERELISSQEIVKLKKDEVACLSMQILQIKTESEAILVEKSTFEVDLSKNRDLVHQLTKELKQNQTDLIEKENQIDELQKAESAMVESHKSSKDVELNEMKQQVAELIEINNRLREQNDKLEISKEQMATATEEIEAQNLAEMNHLKETVEKLNIENRSLSSLHDDLTKKVHQFEINSESYQQRENAIDYKVKIEELSKNTEALNLRVVDLLSENEKMRVDLEKAKSQNICLTDENVDLATEIEKVRRDSVESKRDEINALQLEIKALLATNSKNASRIEELQKSTSTNNQSVKIEADLKIALSDLESKILECQQAQEREKLWMNDNKILSAKLTKHREMTSQKEAEWAKEKAALSQLADNKIKENRLELEGKLDKMKEKMKHLYTEETSKAKEKHEREITQITNENRVLLDKYNSHNRAMSQQIYKLNDQQLQIQKENEFLKNKLRLAENNPRESKLFSAPNFGSNLKMEDEEGEIFNNTYLADLKSGITRTSPTGRDSIRFSELQQRNSMAARHLRSTYSAQYGDQNLKEEDISMPYFNDSMFSNQLDVRRGTLYQRPGPPTPSKNGGRLSFGGNVTASDLFPKEVLREQNNNAKTKTTPGKLMAMFSSSKSKVETMQRKYITRPIYSSFTSTPHQKSKWIRERRLTLLNAPKSIQLTEIDKLDDFEDDATSTTSENSLSSHSNRKILTRKCVGRRFSIISKQGNRSVLKGLLSRNRLEYRAKNHSKRLKDFELSRSATCRIVSSSDDVSYQQNEENYLEQLDILPIELTSSERFEGLAKLTTSEHPYSNEPTATEPNESSLLLSSFSHSRTMFSNILIHGKIPKITINQTPQRELIQSNRRKASLWFRNMDIVKKIILITIFTVLCVPCAIYAMSYLFIRKND